MHELFTKGKYAQENIICEHLSCIVILKTPGGQVSFPVKHYLDDVNDMIKKQVQSVIPNTVTLLCL